MPYLIDFRHLQDLPVTVALDQDRGQMAASCQGLPNSHNDCSILGLYKSRFQSMMDVTNLWQHIQKSTLELV